MENYILDRHNLIAALIIVIVVEIGKSIVTGFVMDALYIILRIGGMPYGD